MAETTANTVDSCATKVRGDNTSPHYIGHRNRIRKKWVETLPQTFADYEL